MLLRNLASTGIRAALPAPAVRAWVPGLLLPLLGGLALPGAPAAAPGEASGAPALGARVQEDPVVRLRQWLARQRRAAEVDEAARKELAGLVAELRLLAQASPERRAEVDLALLDVLAFEPPPPPEPPPAPGPGGGPGVVGVPHGPDPTRLAFQRIAAEELRERLGREGDALPGWLASEVLASPESHDVARRRAAAALLVGHQVRPALQGLLRATGDPDEEVRALAVEALVGWRDPAVHAFFLEAIGGEAVPVRAIGAHLAAAREELGPQPLARLRADVGRLYVSEDWRDAARAGWLVQALDAERSVPVLIEALELWTRRGAEGRGSRRIQHEIVEELRRLSGRSIGLSPERWKQWWTAVREGRVDLAEERDAQGTGASRATFFGLRPVSDRVVFVVDRSGSMRTRFGTSGRERFDEALEQLFRFLEESGEETRFGLVVFNHEAGRWRTKLAPATGANLAAARSWLGQRRHRPDGGTALAEGVREAVLAGRDFELDLGRLEADTVVVLCDGESTGGRAWLRPLLRQATGPAQLIFHCVRIGRAGDGVLEALADESGGDFVAVDG